MNFFSEIYRENRTGNSTVQKRYSITGKITGLFKNELDFIAPGLGHRTVRR
mgnify:CR=1 FL=1